jgi:hypothetical protein
MIKDWKKVKLEKDDESGDIIYDKGDNRLMISTEWNYKKNSNEFIVALRDKTGKWVNQGSPTNHLTFPSRKEALKFAYLYRRNH